MSGTRYARTCLACVGEGGLGLGLGLGGGGECFDLSRRLPYLETGVV